MTWPLWTLLGLQLRATRRRLLRGARTPRGLTFFVLGFFMMFAWLGPAIYRASHIAHTDPQLVRTIAPFAILGFCLSNLFASFGDKAIIFTGAEVDFLFAGPFSRRSLLAYKIVKTALGATFTTLIFSVLLLRYTQLWIACFVGLWLTIQFIQLFAIAVTMLGQTVGERAYSSARRIVLLAAAILLVAVAAPIVISNSHGSALETMSHVHATLPGRMLLAPFDIFARAITARQVFPDLLEWAAMALLIDLLMLTLVFNLDANYLESAAIASQRRYERTQRMRRGGVGSLSASASPKFSLPALPWLGGAGPIAWRQLLSAARTSRALLTTVGTLAVLCFFIFSQRGGTRSLETLFGAIAWLNVVFISKFKFDFRDDLDRLDLLRSLPINANAIAAAEIFTPVLLLTLMQALLLMVIAFYFPGAKMFVIWGAAFAIPFNVLLAAIENLLFLMFPVRSVGLIAGDMQLFGRQMVIFLCKFLLLIVGLGLAAAIGLIGFITGKSWNAFGIAMWVGLILVSLAMIPLLAHAFSRFDPSVDTPA